MQEDEFPGGSDMPTPSSTNSENNQNNQNFDKMKGPNIPNIERIEKPVSMAMQTERWLKTRGWKNNPFTFSITPSLFVGYDYERQQLLNVLKEMHKLVMILGPTGSGKTTLLRWLAENLKGFKIIYLEKPPGDPAEFVSVMNESFKPPIFFRPFISNIKNIFQIPELIRKRTKGHLVLLVDEVHEADAKILEWLRVFSDLDDVSVVLSGLPIFETKLDNLETFRKRVVMKIELLSLTKEETKQMIKKRIISAGGNGSELDSVIDYVYSRSGGYPREVLRICNDIVNRAMRNGSEISNVLLEKETEKPVITGVFDNLTPMQRYVLELLKKPLTPGQIANLLNLEKYKSRQHAVRSVNNILKMLMAAGFVERSRDDRAFVYHLSPRVQTLFVDA
ncbi:MAG: ATPase, T2SS/T4P/T4SS family [Candidatus Aenigmatarchaeota archaeon]